MITLQQSKFSLITLLCTLLLLVFTSGCGFLSLNTENNEGSHQQTEENNNSNTTQNTQQQNNEQQNQVTPVQPNQVNAEIPFDINSYIPSDFKPRPKGGIYVYTKEAHAGAISDYFKFDWDEKDILYIQLSDQYKGYDLEPMALEKKNAKTIRVVLKVKATDDVGKPDEDPARVFIKVPKGSLQGYSFEVVDESGKQLNLQ